jgi:hypothetical protein
MSQQPEVAIPNSWAKKRKAMDDPQAIQLALDANSQIQQVNMLVPGYSCTVAFIEPDLRTLPRSTNSMAKR